MNARTLLGGLALIILALLVWELRWVLLVLFGAVVLAVALDVPISALRRLLPLLAFFLLFPFPPPFLFFGHRLPS